MLLFLLRADTVARGAIFQREFAENPAERGDLRVLDDTSRVAEPEKELVKAVDHSTMDQSQQTDAFGAIAEKFSQSKDKNPRVRGKRRGVLSGEKKQS